MKLLICTQAVDLDDPLLGFFHRWIEEFAKHAERVHVICLKEGKHTLPANVSVYSLGKERGVSRAKYIWNFYRRVWTLRHEYDAVFVHMNPEYVVLGGPLWRVWGKRIVLWRNHKQGGALVRSGAFLSHAVCYTSPETYVAKYANAVRMPVGIDTERFAPPSTPPAPGTVLFIGRLDPVKRPERFVAALKLLADEGVEFRADLYGDPTNPDSPHVSALQALSVPLVESGRLAFHHSVPNAQTPPIYGAHAVYVNLTPSGSFDKTIGEAMACGCLVVAGNDALRGVLTEPFLAGDSAKSVARALKAAFSLPGKERALEAARLRAYVEEHHSLRILFSRLLALFDGV